MPRIDFVDRSPILARRDDTDTLWGAAIENIRDATYRVNDPSYVALRKCAIDVLTALRAQMEKLPH